MKKRLMTSAIATSMVMGLVLSAGTLSARPHGMGGHKMHEPAPIMALVHELDLSEAQEDGIDELMQQGRREMRDTKKALRDGQKALRDAALAEPYNEVQVRELAESQGRLKTAMILKRIDTQRQVRALLTAGQLAELDALRAERKSCRRAAR